MPVKGGTNCIKYLLFCFNLAFWLAGIASLALGLWFRFAPNTIKFLKSEEEIFKSESETSTFSIDEVITRDRILRIWIDIHIFIIVGAVMMVVGFLGWCGAIRESQCMLGLFFTFLLIIFVLEVAVAILGFLNKEKMPQGTQKFYDSLLENRNDKKVRAYLKTFHMSINCCGPNGIPETDYEDTCPENPVACPKAIDDYFKNKLNLIGAIGIVIAVVMIFGMNFSMILCCAIRRDREMVFV